MKLHDGTPTWREALSFFLAEYLPRHRGLAALTLESYATTLRLLLDRLGPRVTHPNDLDVATVFSFLDFLERERGNGVASRNQRLAAMKSFWKAMALWNPTHRDRYEHLLTIPFKRTTSRAPDYLEPAELAALLKVPDPGTHLGFRDMTILRYMYNTGSRISEVAQARIDWLSLGATPEVRIRGKGGKSRICPLWATTAEMLRVYLRSERVSPDKGYEEFLFTTRLGTRFRRAGLWKLIRGHIQEAARTTPSLGQKHLTPHSLRHTTAVHLLRAGVEINVIKAWLGHADVSTTSIYLDLDMDKKREALERFLKLDIDRLTGSNGSHRPLPAHIVSWLERI